MRNENNDKGGEKAALWGGIGAAAGTMFGVILSGSLGILFIAVFGILGAVAGVIAGYIYGGKRSGGE